MGESKQEESCEKGLFSSEKKRGKKTATTAFVAHPAHVPAAVAEPDTHLERTKDAIYGHPLFPLFAIIFKKCELAMCTPRKLGAAVNDAFSSESFDKDIAVFFEHLIKEKYYYIADPELDSLMVQAIQVLRIQLMELEKVQELTDTFCTRYISYLKTKNPDGFGSGFKGMEFGNDVDSTDDSEFDLFDLIYRNDLGEQKTCCKKLQEVIQGIFKFQPRDYRKGHEGRDQ